MLNVQYYCFLANIMTTAQICKSPKKIINFVNLPKREQVPLIDAQNGSTILQLMFALKLSLVLEKLGLMHVRKV